MGGGFEQVGDPSDVTNVNPLTGDILQTLLGQLQAGGQGAEQLISGLQNFDFLDVLDDPRLQGAIGTFAGERTTLAKQAAEQAQRQISGQFAGTGLYSGAFGEAVGQGVGQAFQAGATDIAGKQLGLFGGALGIAGQQQAGALNFFGQQQAGALQGLTAFGRPEFFNPTFVESSGGVGAGIAGAGSLGTLGFLAGGPLGAGIGAGIGGLLGLFS